MKLIQTCSLACLLLTLSLTGHRLGAQTLNLSPTSIGNLSHTFYGAGSGGDDQQTFTFATPSVQLINYNTIKVSVNAPVGKAWNVSFTGQGFSSANLRYEIFYNNGFSSPFASVTSSSLQFDYVNGSAASLGSYSDVSSIPDQGDRFEVNMSYNVTGDFSFSGFTATVVFDNSTLSAAPLSSFVASYLDYQYQPSNVNAPNPGPVLTLQSVPEPSCLTLIGLGFSALGALTWYRRI